MFYFTPLPGFFSPFPRGTGSLSVTQEYLALRDGSRGFTRGIYRATRDSASIRSLSTTRLSLSLVQDSFASSSVCDSMSLSHNPKVLALWFRLFPLRSPLLGESIFFLFLQLLRCFSLLRSLVLVYGFNQPFLGLPHSDIFGSRLASSSPKRFVGNHVLRRLCVPRYPP
jgi:hypothetical protein